MSKFEKKKFKVKRFELNKRESQTKRGYDNEWVKYRAKFIKHNPACYVCGSNYKINVDHIKAHKGDNELFWNNHNHMPLCQHCHSFVTGKFDRYEVQKLEEKIEWIKEQRELRKIDIKIKVIKVPTKKGNSADTVT